MQDEKEVKSCRTNAWLLELVLVVPAALILFILRIVFCPASLVACGSEGVTSRQDLTLWHASPHITYIGAALSLLLVLDLIVGRFQRPLWRYIRPGLFVFSLGLVALSFVECTWCQ